MYCRLLTQYAIIMVSFLGGLRKIKLHTGMGGFKRGGGKRGEADRQRYLR